ncbi:hypothetical protein LCGC14_1990410 [marine sediment metagenome]|uniref:Uncharacterized protein n=1 Tax=marine sediment metagenome TaxID=412755 RepID=A0A0F9F636_9ZZZZ
MNLNRNDRRKLLNMAGREIQFPGTPEEQLAAEEQLRLASENPQSSFATTMSILAHTWFTLDQAREAARMTYIRAVKLREKGREMSTTTVVKQYEEAQVEIEIVESQVVELLRDISAHPDEGVDSAIGLLGSSHTNIQSGIAVRLPHGVQVRLALESEIMAPEEDERVVDTVVP